LKLPFCLYFQQSDQDLDGTTTLHACFNLNKSGRQDSGRLVIVWN